MLYDKVESTKRISAMLKKSLFKFTKKNIYLFILLSNGVNLNAAQIEINMATSNNMNQVRFGEEFNLNFSINNPNGITLAGYQAHWDWDSNALEMTGPPALDSQSILNDLFDFNAPPYGLGWSTCPSAGDSLDREGGLALGIALSPGSLFSGTSGHLFQISFRAKQAKSQNKTNFIFNGFYPCINQETLISDPSGGSVSTTLINAELEVTPSLAVTGNFQLGGNADFEVHEKPGLPWTIGYGFTPSYKSFGNIGVLYFDAFASSSGIIDSGIMNNKEEIISITIPPLSFLSGKTIYTQALTGSGPQRRLSNLVSFTIL